MGKYLTLLGTNDLSTPVEVAPEAVTPIAGTSAAQPRRELIERVRRHRPVLLALPQGGPENPTDNRAAWTREVVPDSRRPLIPSDIRGKIEAIEAEARAKGWPAELLWNAGFWDLPRGLAAVLDSDDEIIEIAADHIAILKTKRDLLRFRRVNA